MMRWSREACVYSKQEKWHEIWINKNVYINKGKAIRLQKINYNYANKPKVKKEKQRMAICSVQQWCIEFWHGSLPSVEGGLVVLIMPRLQHTACLGVRVCIDHRGLGEIATWWWLAEKTCSASRIPTSSEVWGLPSSMQPTAPPLSSNYS